MEATLVKRLILLAAAALALTACGSSSDTETATTEPTVTTAAPTTTTTPAVDVAADKAKARALVLTRSDMPAEWKATPHKDDPSDKQLDNQLASCVGRPSPSSYLTARANSPDFASGDAEVSSDALLVKTVEDYNADVEAAKGPKYMPCVKRVLTSALRQVAGDSVQSISVARLPIQSDADFSVGFRAKAKLLVQGQTVTFYQDGILLGKERIELSASFSDVQKPPDADLERAVVSKLDAKLAAA
jgi:uncharacterized lipoprotein YmbA